MILLICALCQNCFVYSQSFKFPHKFLTYSRFVENAIDILTDKVNVLNPNQCMKKQTIRHLVIYSQLENLWGPSQDLVSVLSDSRNDAFLHCCLPVFLYCAESVVVK